MSTQKCVAPPTTEITVFIPIWRTVDDYIDDFEALDLI